MASPRRIKSSEITPTKKSNNHVDQINVFSRSEAVLMKNKQVRKVT